MSEFVFYVYDDSPDDPRFSLWVEGNMRGRSLFELPPDGEGMWLKPSNDESEFPSVKATDELEQVLGKLGTGGVDGSEINDLDSHERRFVEAIYGTVQDDPDKIPAPVWNWIERCADEVDDNE